MTWGYDRRRDAMLGHDFPAVCGSGMHDFTVAEIELGARVALELSDDSRAQALDVLDQAVWERGEHPQDYGSCPYFAYIKGVAEFAACTRGCREEPRCVTEEPEGGWPSARLAGLYERS